MPGSEARHSTEFISLVGEGHARLHARPSTGPSASFPHGTPDTASTPARAPSEGGKTAARKQRARGTGQQHRGLLVPRSRRLRAPSHLSVGQCSSPSVETAGSQAAKPSKAGTQAAADPQVTSCNPGMAIGNQSTYSLNSVGLLAPQGRDRHEQPWTKRPGPTLTLPPPAPPCTLACRSLGSGGTSHTYTQASTHQKARTHPQNKHRQGVPQARLSPSRLPLAHEVGRTPWLVQTCQKPQKA